MALPNVWDEASVAWDVHQPGVFVEVGGFEGRWLAEMAARYDGRFHAYEPQGWALDRIRRSFVDVRREHAVLDLHPYGLGPKDDLLPMGGWETDACSFLKTPEWYAEHPDEGRRTMGVGEIRRASEALPPGMIDVMMMNIEGFEYRLLPALYADGVMRRIRHLAVQFHRDYEISNREALIRSEIAETHDQIWEWPALTAWKLREDER